MRGSPQRGSAARAVRPDVQARGHLAQLVRLPASLHDREEVSAGGIRGERDAPIAPGRAGPGRPRRTSGLAYARRSPCGRPRQEQRDIAPAHAAADVADPAASSPAALRDDRYFPARPSGVRTSAIVGTLTDYGIGTASGALVIRTAAWRTVRFAVAAPPFRVNGRAIDCTVAPRDGVRRASRPHALPELARKPARRSFARARDVLARHAIRKADARHGRDQIAALKTNEAPDRSDASFRVGVGVEVAIVVRYLGGGVARTRG